MTDVQELIIAGSMVGLGLIIAIYTLAYPRLDEIFSRAITKLNKRDKELKELIEKLRKEPKNEKLATDLPIVQRRAKEAGKLSFHHDWGFFVSSAFFTVALLAAMINVFDVLPGLCIEPTSMCKGMAGVIKLSPLFFSIGTLFFLYVWFRLMLELRGLAVGKFERAREELSKTEKEAKKFPVLEEALKQAEKRKKRLGKPRYFG